MGTNTVLVSVVDASSGLVWEGSRITRLGAGVDASKTLRHDAIDRTLAAVEALANEARGHGAERVVGVGTSALRDASNRDAFVSRARGIVDAFDVIHGAREAELTFRGAFFGIDAPRGEITVVDIGGGSTEIVRGEGTVVHSRTSVDVGSVRLTERFGIGDAAPTRSQIDALRAAIASAMQKVEIRAPLVALAGTATNVAAVARGIDLAHGASQPHGLSVSATELRGAIARIACVDRDTRRGLVGIEPGREDVIVAGASILEHVIDRAGASEVLVSDGGVRFGLALDAIATDDLSRSS